LRDLGKENTLCIYSCFSKRTASVISRGLFVLVKDPPAFIRKAHTENLSILPKAAYADIQGADKYVLVGSMI